LGFISISCDDEYLFICQDLDYQYAQWTVNIEENWKVQELMYNFSLP
jgi:hypothetical protein